MRLLKVSYFTYSPDHSYIHIEDIEDLLAFLAKLGDELKWWQFIARKRLNEQVSRLLLTRRILAYKANNRIY